MDALFRDGLERQGVGEVQQFLLLAPKVQEPRLGQFLEVVDFQPLLIGGSASITQLLLHERQRVDLRSPAPEALPVFQRLVEMDGNLVPAGAAVVDDALLQQGVRMVQHEAAEFRRDDAALPAEVDVRHVDARGAMVLVDRENALVEEALEPLEIREHGPDVVRHLLHQVDGARAADGEEDDLADAAAPAAKTVHHLPQAQAQGVARRNDVADDERPAPRDADFLVLDLQAGDDVVLDDALAGNEVHVPHADAVPGASLLHGIVQPAPKDGENIDVAALALRKQVAEGGDGGGKHRQIGIEADDFRIGHQLAGSRATQNIIAVGKLRPVQFVQARLIVQAHEAKARILQKTGHKKPD